jgi:DME family drug/metabolite transporter
VFRSLSSSALSSSALSSSALSSSARTPFRSVATVHHSRAGLLKISAAGLLWGTTGVVVQVLHQTTALSPVGIGFYRLAVAAVVLLVICRPRAIQAAFRVAPAGLILTGIGLGTYQALYFVAVTLAGVSVATVVGLGLAPVLLAGGEAVRARRLPDRTTSATLITGVLGLLLITVSAGRPTDSAPHPLLGLLAAAGCGVCYAASTAISRRQAQRIDAMTLTTMSTGVGALALAPLALFGGGAEHGFGFGFGFGFAGIAVPLQPGPLLMLAYLGIITTAVAYALFYAGLRTTIGSTAAVLTLLEPLAAALLAILILGESLSLPALAGGALLLTAVAILYTSPRNPSMTSTPAKVRG